MNKNAKTFVTGFMIILITVALVHAQVSQTGSLSGKVVDTHNEALPGASISITSPALLLRQMSITTNAKGYYRFPSLPVGLYSVTFELSGFNTIVREGVRISFGVTTTLDASIEPKTIDESIVVTGEAPAIDKQSTVLSTTLSKEVVAAIPSSRKIMEYVNMTPGMINDSRPNLVGSSSHGSSAKENSYNLDGIYTSEPVSNTQRGGFGIDIVEELSIQSGSLPAEYGRIRGAVLNIVTKSGGNDFHGAASTYYRNIHLQSDNTAGTPLEGQKTGFNYDHSMGFNLGGPIVRNKLWFFANIEYNPMQTFVFDYPYDKDENAPITTKLFNPYAKISYQITPKDKLIFAYSFHSTKSDHNGAGYQRNEETTSLSEIRVDLLSFHYERMFNANWLFNAKAGFMYYKQSTLSKTHGPQYYDETSRLYSGAYGYDQILNRRRNQALVASTYFLDDWIGRHELKGGFEVEYSTEQHDRTNYLDERGLGSSLNTRNNGQPYYVTFNEDYIRRDNRFTLGGFLQDAWRPTDRLVLNIGVRYDHIEGIIPKQGLDREPFVVNADTVIDTRVLETRKPVIWNTFSPRFGVIYDLFGNSRTVLKSSFSRYYMDLYFFHIDVNPNGSLSWRYRLNPDWTINYAYGMYGVSATAINLIDPDLRSPYLDEFTLGIEQEIAKDISLSLRYIKKWDRNLIEDADINALDVEWLKETGEVRWVNYQPVYAVDPYSGEPVTFYEKIDTSVVRSRYKMNPSVAKRDYDGLEIVLKKRFSRGWTMNASYVYGHSRGLIGSHLDESQSTSTFFDDPNSHVNALGRFPLDNRHQFKLLGIFNGPFGITVSGYFRYFSGGRYTRTIRSNDLGLDLNQGNVTIYAEERGSRGYPAQALFDARLEKDFYLPGRKAKLSLMLDLLNAFNSSTATGLQSLSSSSSYTFGSATSLVDPRILRLGLRFEF